MTKKATIFFAYCRNDSENYPFFLYLKNEVEKRSNYKVKVIIDKLDFPVGDDYISREKEILSSDCVVVFFYTKL